MIQSSGARGLFYDTRDLLRVIRSTYNPLVRTTELDILRPVMKADLLVLDDLGAEKTSEWVEETMNLIVNTRYNERRLTLFTSNYENIPDDTDPNALLFRIGHRMRSRLHEMCEFLQLDGADYREMPTNGGRRGHLMTLWKKRSAPHCRSRRRGRARKLRARGDGKADLKWPGGKGRDRQTNYTDSAMLGLYVHVPFCSAICNYCNFNRGLFDAALKGRYVEALVAEIRAGPGVGREPERPTRYFSAAVRPRCSSRRRSRGSSLPVARRSTSRPMPR